jgi:cytoskeletal protein CcmA (bactofilin family)
VLPKLDRIDRLYGNRLLNNIRARRGDTLYHCIFCRLQFYDPRQAGPPASGSSTDGSSEKSESSEPGAAPIRASEIQPVLPPAPDPVSKPESPRAPAVPEPAPLKSAAPVPAPASHTTFGYHVLVRGSVSSTEDICIEGRIEGTVTLRDHRVTIGPGGRVKADIQAGDLEILGNLRGNSHVRRKTSLRSGCNVTGDIRTGEIIIDDGACFKGSVDLVRHQPELPFSEPNLFLISPELTHPKRKTAAADS